MINMLRVMFWTFSFVAFAVLAILWMGRIATTGLDDRAMAAILLGAIGFAVLVWHWVVFRR